MPSNTPSNRRYHAGWGRTGDFGVVAEFAFRGDRDPWPLAGAACARLHSQSDHGHGFVDEFVPELGVAVAVGHRGQGIGEALMLALAERGRRLGFERLSLSVNNPNPAKRLYERLGYRTVADDGDSSVMVLELT